MVIVIINVSKRRNKYPLVDNLSMKIRKEYRNKRGMRVIISCE